ncbi:hypothetical protein [Streptomyces sp. A0958]|uniref:hypothetical protein n=1 Tax=Streptomyces sp. A0958 TaxID=2563101 RepID=UPI00144511DC|nr:hypothetical protein [Streptomyces sp. A0958]
MGVLLAVLGGQFMSGLSQGTSVRTGVSAAGTASTGLLQVNLDRPQDDRWD